MIFLIKISRFDYLQSVKLLLMKKTMIMGKNAENTGIGFNNVFSSYIIFKNRYKMARKTSTNRQTHKAHKMKMHMRNYK